MITEEHLQHWLSEMQWQLDGINTELSKEKYKDTKGLDINGNHLSLKCLREKLTHLQGLKRCVENDMVND